MTGGWAGSRGVLAVDVATRLIPFTEVAPKTPTVAYAPAPWEEAR